MSTIIMSQCWPLQMPPTAKSVLISLADNANDHGVCWPSLQTIALRTCFSERAVQNAIKWLEQHGVLRADRSNGRHTSYIVSPASYIEPVQPATSHPKTYPQPPQEMHPRSRCTPAGDAPTPAGGAGVPPQEIRIPPQEVPSNRKEPSLEPSGNRQLAASAKFDAVAVLTALEVDRQTIADWLVHRKTKRGAVSLTVIESRVEEAGKAGLSLRKALQTEMSRNWQGFEAAWLTGKGGARNGAQQTEAQRQADNDEAYRLLYGKNPSEVIDV